jgi:uncharacterized coiled-coil DUF342 family protein
VSVSKFKFDILLDRLLQLGRKYRKELDNVFDKIEEEYQQYENIASLRNALRSIKIIV